MSQVLDFQLPEHLAARQAARRREVGTQIIAAVVAVACLVGGGVVLLPSINAIRQERQLVIDPKSIKGLPPDIQLLGKLGTFRALAIDWASIRADRLKEEGKTYEALELHKTVCRLQPRFATAWATAAWNMAYNISVMQYTPEQRWQWVNNGIKLLRDEGIQYNPKSVTLYKELSFIFWHKIGDYLDDEHLNYKRALAVEWERVLGPQPIALRTEDTIAWFRKIVDAPRDLDAFIASDANVSALVERLRQLDLPPDETLLEFVARNIRPELRVEELLANRAEEDPVHKARMDLLTDPAEQETVDRLLCSVRSRAIRERYKMDLDWMLDLMVNQYGPLDWRTPFAHTLYWSSLGDKYAPDVLAQNPADWMNTARMIFFALHSLSTRGRVVLHPDFDEPFKSYIALTPDTRFIPFMLKAYEEKSKEQFPEAYEIGGVWATSYATGFVTFLMDAIELLYFEGGEKNLEMAENFLLMLRDNAPNPDGSTQEQFTKGVQAFVEANVISQMGTFRQSSAIIRRLINKSLKEQAVGNAEAATRSLNLAQLAYEYWMKDTTRDINDRKLMQPIHVQRNDEVENFLTTAEYEPYFKARLWRELDKETRQAVYDRVIAYLTQMCAAMNPPWDVALAFPEPPGMEQYRQSRPDLELRDPQEGAERGERHKQ